MDSPRHLLRCVYEWICRRSERRTTTGSSTNVNERRSEKRSAGDPGGWPRGEVRSNAIRCSLAFYCAVETPTRQVKQLRSTNSDCQRPPAQSEPYSSRTDAKRRCADYSSPEIAAGIDWSASCTRSAMVPSGWWYGVLGSAAVFAVRSRATVRDLADVGVFTG
uniref:Uncharacterized protein n=1 Tax=Plectus sambesii TaxID=2011161 RepID=A0A914VES1_9BILA